MRNARRSLALAAPSALTPALSRKTGEGVKSSPPLKKGGRQRSCQGGFYSTELIISLLSILFLLGTFWVLPPAAKLSLFTMVEKPFFRLRSSKPSSFLNETQLKQKLAKDAPIWAKEQIREDLSKFSSFTAQDLDNIFKENTNANNKLVRIKIKNAKLEVITQDPTLLQHKSYKIMHNVFQYLAKNGHIPDTDFILCLQDYMTPLSKKPVPIFTFSKDTSLPGEKDLILIPDWMNLRNWGELKSRIQYANHLFPWEKKQPILFWRGSVADSSGFRRKLVSLSAQHPTLINAVFSQNNPKEYVSEEKHVPYRYQITIDGARGTWERLVWQLQSNCLVFKQKSSHVQWFYKGISPNVDYISVQDEASVLKRIAWAEEHPDEAKKIIDHAQGFAENNLSLEDMYHYIAVLLKAYNQKLRPHPDPLP